jgi:lipopolysaccharide cholinephosphotransferase
VPIPVNYVEILHNFYGDYLTYPPLEQRGLWHEGMITFEPRMPYIDFF